MVAAVAAHGFEATRVTEIVAMAGVSNTAFYRHFGSKTELFLATFDEIVRQGGERIEAAYRTEGDLEDGLQAGLQAFAELAGDEREATRLVLIESLALGRTGVAVRQRAAARFEAMIARSFEDADMPLSEFRARALVAGMRRVAYCSLRDRGGDFLASGSGELAGWALRVARSPEELDLPAATQVEDQHEEPGWGEPPSDPRARALLSRRERILRAVAQLAAEEGYAALNMPAIAARAGASNEAFYAEFEDKQQAFLIAFEVLLERTVDVTSGAFEAQEGWAAGVAAGLHALLAHLAAEPIAARLAFFELPAAGAAGLDRSDRAMSAFLSFLRPSNFGAKTEGDIGEVTREAIAGGVWAAIQYELAAGRGGQLTELAPRLAAFALTPFGVRELSGT